MVHATKMSAMLTMLATSADVLFDEGCAVALLFILVYGVALLQSRLRVALLQSRLIKAAGRWTQHSASAIQLNNSKNISRTCTSAAELFYLRHTRSCAATACGNKGGGTSHSIPLQMSGADFIAGLLQSICQQVCLTIIMHWGRVLLALFRPSARLLQSIWRHCYVTVFLPLDRLLQSIGQMVLTWFTPLELAACLYLADAYSLGVSNHCRVSAVNAPSAKEIATIALALLILTLSIIDWHVPREVPCHHFLCRILTAMSTQALGMNLACTIMAFLLPTFGRAQRTNPRANPTPHSPAHAPTHPWAQNRRMSLRCASFFRKSELLACTRNATCPKV